MLYFALVFPLVVVVAVVAIALTRRGPFHKLVIGGRDTSPGVSTRLRMRLRNFAAIAAATFFAAFLTAVSLLGMRTTERNGGLDALHLFLLTPMLTAIIAVTFFAFVPTFRETAEVRRAELLPRTPLTFGSRAVFLLPEIAAALPVATIAALAFIADVDGRTFSHDFGINGGAVALGPFPGWFYGVPLLLVLAFLVAVVVLALRRIASAPRPSDESLRDADSAMRFLAVRVVMKTVTSALILTLGIVLCMAGSVTLSATAGIQVGADGTPVPPDVVLQLVGTLEFWSGVAFMIATIVFVVGAISDAIRDPFAIARITGAAPAVTP